MAHTTAERMSEALVAELQAFVDCVIHDTESPVPFRDGRATVEVAVAATRSIHTGTPVDL
jgi:myo-inositol 2-dehydrogenase/D-chiro-inositol 1-dehydrogenase